jgi:hypothetical protein
VTPGAAPTAVIEPRTTDKSRRATGKPVVHRISLHGVAAEISAPRSLNRTLSIVLGGYPAAHPASAPAIQIAVKPGDSGRPVWQVVDGEHTYPESDKNGMPAIRAEWLFISTALKHWPDFVHVHAGLIATHDRSALLIGKSGSGKSTTTMALALNGLDVYTDDVALLDRASLRALCVPRPIKLDRRSRAMLRQRGLVIPPRRRLNESIDRLILPGLPNVEEPGPPLGSALFFSDSRAERPSLRPISGAEAVLRLIQQSASERFDESGPSEGALAIVNAVPCYELVSADLDSTVRLIQCHMQQALRVGPAG